MRSCTLAGLPSHNLLVISDLHLGEDLKPATKSGYLPHVPMLERELESFLDHYRKSRRDGRPWELIINGDMVDFLSVCLFPDGVAVTDSPDDHVWGLGTGADNKLGIVVGNHDVEFHWPVVQETFKKGLATVWAAQPAAARPGARTTDELEA